MSRMSLETAIRLSAEVKGGANITKVQRSLQDLAKGSQTTARQMGTLRSATFQYARANSTTIAGIRNSVAAFRGLQEQAKIGSREFIRYGTEIQKLEGKLRGLDGTAQKAGASLGKNLAAGLAAAGVGRALQGITAQAGRFDAELRKAAAIEGGAGSFGVLRKEIEAVAAVAAGTPTQVAELATALSRAGFSAEQTSQALRGVVMGAEATDIAFADMGGIVGTILKTFQMNASQTGAVVDSLVKSANSANQTVTDVGEAMSYAAGQASALGVSVDDTLGLIALLADAGVRGSRAGTTLATGFNRLQIAAGGGDSEMQDLIKGSAKMVDAMNQLGASVLDAEGKLRPMDQVLIAIKRQMKDLSTTDQTILSKALFGADAGKGFLAVLQRSEADIIKMIGAVNNAGGTAEETREKMRGFDDSVKILGGNFENLTNQIGGMIGGALKPLIDGLNTAIGASQKLPEPVKAIGAAAAAAALSVLGLVVAINALKASLAIVGGIQAVTAAISLKSAAMALAAGTAKALAVALVALPWVAVAAGVVAFGVALYNAETQHARFNQQVREGTVTADQAAAKHAELTAKVQELRQQLQTETNGRMINTLRARLRTATADAQELLRVLDTVRLMSGENITPSMTRQGYSKGASGLEYEVAGVGRFRVDGDQAMIPTAPAVGSVVGGGGSSGSGGGGAAAGGGGGGGGGAAKKQAESLGAQIAKSLAQALDLTPAQAAGVVGNLMRESGLNPRINEGGAVGAPRGVGGYGLAQWTGSRQQDLVRFAGGPAAAGDMQTQLRFMVSELMGPESRALASLRRATTPEEAAVVFDRDYERSGIKALPERKANARRVYGEIAGTGPGAGLDDFAGQLKSQADLRKAMQDRLQTAKDLLITGQDRLNILAAEGALEKLIAESRIKQRNTEEEYNKKINEPGAGVEEKQTLQLALQKSLQGDSIELERGIAALREDAIKPMTDITKQYGDRLAYEREYGGLLATGINPELAKQFMEIDRIAQASKMNLETQVATLETMIAQLPVDSALRKSLEDQVKLKRELLGLVPKAAAEAKDDATETAKVVTDREKQQADAERLKGLYESIGSTLEEGLIGALQTGIDGLIDGTQRLDDALKQILSGVLRDIANQLLRFAVNTALKSAAPGLFANGGVFGGGSVTPFANGGVFGGGSVTPFANGGVVNEPTMFKFAQGGAMQNGLMGEADPEAIMPLRRGPDGRLGVEAIGIAVPFQSTPTAAPNDLAVPFQGAAAPTASGAAAPSQAATATAASLAVPFMKSGNSSPAAMAAEAARAMASTPLEPIRLQVESRVINGVEYVTTSQLREATEAAAMAGRDSAYDGMRNNPSIQRSLGMR